LSLITSTSLSGNQFSFGRAFVTNAECCHILKNSWTVYDSFPYSSPYVMSGPSYLQSKFVKSWKVSDVTRAEQYMQYGMILFGSKGTLKLLCKGIPVTGCGGPKGCEESRLPHFLDIGSQMVVRLSALLASYPLPPGRFLVLISIRGWVDPKALLWLEGFGKLKNPLKSGIEPMTSVL
jgi:hypothetical protein